jgi:Protein of unknown function (DUF2752)
MVTSGVRPAGPGSLVGGGIGGRTAFLRAARAPLATAAGLLLATGYVGVVDPNQHGHYPTCPFLALTGLYCPGCGTLRAVHALAHLDLTGAASKNVLFLAMLPVMAALWLGWLRRSVTGRSRWVAPPWTIYLLFAVILAFGVLRNLPGLEILAP